VRVEWAKGGSGNFYPARGVTTGMAMLRVYFASHSEDESLGPCRQNKELCALAQKVATEAAEPNKTGVTKAFNKAI
jgi:hypothetical protein